MTIDRTEGVTKLIVDPQTERVLGVGIVGPSAGEHDRRRRAGGRDGRQRHRSRADHSSAPDVVGDGDGCCRSTARHRYGYLSPLAIIEYGGAIISAFQRMS